jgi:hypothetical protein
MHSCVTGKFGSGVVTIWGNLPRLSTEREKEGKSVLSRKGGKSPRLCPQVLRHEQDYFCYCLLINNRTLTSPPNSHHNARIISREFQLLAMQLLAAIFSSKGCPGFS